MSFCTWNRSTASFHLYLSSSTELVRLFFVLHVLMFRLILTFTNTTVALGRPRNLLKSHTRNPDDMAHCLQFCCKAAQNTRIYTVITHMVFIILSRMKNIFRSEGLRDIERRKKASSLPDTPAKMKRFRYRCHSVF
jgi:hypothetical protein